MNKSILLTTAFSIVILFFIQLAGTLVESIYILDLMNLKLDEKVLGLFFLFAPIPLFPLFKKYARQTAWTMGILLFVTRGLLPYLKTSDRMLAAGLGTVAALTLLFLLVTKKLGRLNARSISGSGAAGFGMAVLLSAFLRSVGQGLDYSLIPAGAWVGWMLSLVLMIAVILLATESPVVEQAPKEKVTGAVVGIILVLTFIWFSFSAPSVIARWTQGNYTLIVTTISLLTAGGIWICIARPQLLDRLSPGLLLTWNILFTLALSATLLSQGVAYPSTPDSPVVVVTGPSTVDQVLLVLMLILFPVLLLDARLFIYKLSNASPAPRDLMSGFLLGMSCTVVLIFINIFSNVWGYVPPVSTVFRGTFWLSFFLMAGGISLLAWLMRGIRPQSENTSTRTIDWVWAIVLGAIAVGTIIRSLPAQRAKLDAANRTLLIVMTYNTQQSNDNSAEKSFERQLAIMRKISPDIIALQESDSARISLNNNDYVRYFAEQLGYYSYYGPATVTGTYGTAVLSRYPLENTRTVFTYSDQDEIGTTEAEITAGGRRFTIYDVHPDGSAAAKLAFAKSLLERSQDKPNVIALGDFNLREDEEPYRLIDSVYKNAWTSAYPSGIDPQGMDMSGEDQIDHIFVSPSLEVRNPMYLLPPDSATDHPVHWAEIGWQGP